MNSNGSNNNELTSEERAANRDRERQALKGFLSEKKRLLSITLETSLENLNESNSQIQHGVSPVAPKGHSGYDERSRISPPQSPKIGEFGLGIKELESPAQSHWATGVPTTMRKTRWEGSQEIIVARWIPSKDISPTSEAILLPSPETIDSLLFRAPFLPPISAKPLPPTPPEIAFSESTDKIDQNNPRLGSNWTNPPVSPARVPMNSTGWPRSPSLVAQPTTSNAKSLSPSPTIRVSPTVRVVTVFNPLTPPLLPLPSIPSHNSISSLSSLSISLSPAREFFSSAAREENLHSSGSIGSNSHLGTSTTSGGTFSSRSNKGSISSSSSNNSVEEEELENDYDSKIDIVVEAEDEEEEENNDSDNSDKGKSHVDFSALLSSPLPKRRYSKRRPSIPLSPSTNSFRSTTSQSPGLTRQRSFSQSPRGSTSHSMMPPHSPFSNNSNNTEDNSSFFEADLLEDSIEEENESESAESEIDVDASLETLAWRSGVMGRASKSDSETSDDEDDRIQEEGDDLTPRRRDSKLRINIQQAQSKSLRRSHSKLSPTSEHSDKFYSPTTTSPRSSLPHSESYSSLRKSIPNSLSRSTGGTPTSPGSRTPIGRSSSVSSLTSLSRSTGGRGNSLPIQNLSKSQDRNWKPIVVEFPSSVSSPGNGNGNVVRPQIGRSNSMISISKIPGPTSSTNASDAGGSPISRVSRLPTMVSRRPSSILSRK